MTPSQSPRDNPREGYGSSYILPRRENRSATDAIVNYIDNRRRERMAGRQQLQKQLIDLEGVTANALPNHQQELKKRYSDLINWYAESRASGSNPADPNTAEYYEFEKRKNALKSDAIKAKMFKDAAIKQRQTFDPKTHDERSLSKALDYFNNTALDELDIQQAPNLETLFNQSDYLQNYTQKFKPTAVEEIDKKSIVPLKDANGHVIRGQYTANKVKKYDLEGIGYGIADDNSYEGKRNQEYILEQFSAMPEDQQERIFQNVQKKNVTAKENPETFKRELIAEMVSGPLKNMFGTTVEPTTISEQQLPREPKPDKEFNPETDNNWTPGTTKVDPIQYLSEKYPENAAYYQSPQFALKQPKVIEKLTQDFAKVPYIAFSVKTGKDNPVLTIDNKAIIPSGFFKGTQGEKYMVGSSQLMDPGQMSMIVAILADKEIPEAKKDDLKKKFGVQVVPLEEGYKTEVASKLGFKSEKRFDEFLNKQLPGKTADNKVAKAAPKTISKTDYSKLSLADRKKKIAEGYKVM